MTTLRRPLALATALAVAWTVRTNDAAAERPSVALRISESAPAGCPKTPTIRERLEAHLGHVRDAAPEEPAIDLAFRIERREKDNHGSVTITSGGVSVERNASSTSCEDVYAALCVMAAVAVGEEAERRSPESAEAPREAMQSGAPPPPSVPSTSVPPPSVPSTRSRRPRSSPAPTEAKRVEPAFGAGFGVNGNRGPVVTATWFAQLTLPFRLEPMIRIGLARSTRERISSSRGDLAIRWSEVTFAGCANLLRGAEVRFGPCLNVELGRLEASLLPPLRTREASFLWFTLGAGLQLVWRVLPHLSVEMMAGAHVPVLRRKLFFEPFSEPVAYHAPLVSPFLLVGFAAHLP